MCVRLCECVCVCVCVFMCLNLHAHVFFETSCPTAANREEPSILQHSGIDGEVICSTKAIEAVLHLGKVVRVSSK